VTPDAALAFVRRHGVVLASGKGPVPNIAEAVAGEPIRGSWWSHARGRDIFRVLGALGDSPELLVCRLVGGKLTFVHRRLWPALARLAADFPKAHLNRVEEVHTAKGHHETHEIPFATWMPAKDRASARSLTKAEARAALGAWAVAKPARAKRRPPR
jgi:hypothetical protein